MRPTHTPFSFSCARFVPLPSRQADRHTYDGTARRVGLVVFGFRAWVAKKRSLGFKFGGLGLG